MVAKILEYFSTNDGIAIVGIITVISGIAALLIFPITSFIKQAYARRATAHLNRRLTATTHASSFTDEDIARALNKYIQPDCAQTDPSNESDLRNVAAVRGKIFETVDDFINQTSSKRHLLILADSGMGKTTFCLNFYAQEQGRKKNRQVAIVPLGRPDALEQIKSIQDKRSTILFMDALDEDSEAIEDTDARLEKLMSVAADFMFIVVTCRSQFFENDGMIPKETGVAAVGPRKAGQPSQFIFNKLYLLPFTSAQIEKYIAAHIPWYRFKQRTDVRKLISDIPELAVRPMLLELIPDLLREKRVITELFQLYQFMVKSWCIRESSWVKENDLLRFSSALAVDIVLNRHVRRSEKISFDDLGHIGNSVAPATLAKHFSSRSLLNRDSEGMFKFAHRSIMEYFFIQAFIDGDERCRDVEWTDLMKALFMSWGRSSSAPTDLARAISILSGNLSQTKLLPFPDQLASPKQFSDNNNHLVQNLRSWLKRGLAVPLPWRMQSYRIRYRGQELIQVADFAYNLTWQLVLTSDMSYDDKKIYKLSYANTSVRDDSDKQNNLAENSYRLPSIQEFVSLHGAEQAHDLRLIDRSQFYWLGDRFGQYAYLACSVGSENMNHSLINLVFSHELSAEEKLYIYSVQIRTAQNAPHLNFSAMEAKVRCGNAELDWYENKHY